MSIKVVDLNNEAVEEETPVLEPIEEVKEEPILAQEQNINNEVVNEVAEDSNVEPPKQEQVADLLNSNKVGVEPKEEPKPKRQTQKDRIQCPKCLKEVSLKTYRYSHEKICQGQLSEKPVKPHTNPRPKGKAKPKPTPKPHEVASKQRAPPEIYYSDDDEEQVPSTQSFIKKKQPPQPINPHTALAQHYQLLQQAMVKQKQERYNNLCMNMFSSKSKKR